MSPKFRVVQISSVPAAQPNPSSAEEAADEEPAPFADVPMTIRLPKLRITKAYYL